MTMNIFEALRESHELQRALSQRVLETSGDTPERQALFKDLREELAAHALAEDRHFYVPLTEKWPIIDFKFCTILPYNLRCLFIDNWDTSITAPLSIFNINVYDFAT